MKKLTHLFTAFLMMALMASCSSDKKNDPAPETGDFAFWIQVGSWPNANYYILGLNSVTEGKAVLAGNGVDVTTILNNSVITRGGYYYYYNTTAGRFGKYQIVNGQVQMVKEVPYTHISSLCGHTWVDNNTLVMMGLDAASKLVRYSVININDLTINSGTLTGVPAIPDGYQTYRLGGDLQYVNGNLLFALNMRNTTTNLMHEKTYMVQVAYNTFTVGSTSSTDLTAGVGNTSGYFATSFVDENKDMYFLTSWNGMWKNGVYAPRYILRVKNGTTVLDPAYHMDVKTEVGFDAAAGLFMNLGNGKAIIKYVTSADATTAENGFAIINITTGKLIRKLTEVPLGLGSERNVLVENGKAYIAVLDNDDKDYIWIYDAATDKVTRGLEIEGGYNSFSRLDRLK